MILRSERHRELLWQIINNFPNFSGAIVHEIVELKAEVATATIAAAPADANGNGDMAPAGDVAGVRHTP